MNPLKYDWWYIEEVYIKRDLEIIYKKYRCLRYRNIKWYDRFR